MIRRKLTFISLILCFAVVLFIPTHVSAQPSTDMDSYVLFALDELSFKGGNDALDTPGVYDPAVDRGFVLDGNVGVNAVDPTPNNSSALMNVGANARFVMSDNTQLVGDSIRLGEVASVYDVYRNIELGVGWTNPNVETSDPVIRNLKFDLSTYGMPPIIDPALLTGDALCGTFTAGTTDVTIPADLPSGSTLTPGAYQDLRVTDGNTLYFDAGTYTFRRFNSGQNVTIYTTEDTIIQIVGDPGADPDFNLGGNGSYLGPVDPNTECIAKFCVLGETVNFSDNGTFYGVMIAPNASIGLGRGFTHYGRFIGKTINSDFNVNVFYQDCKPLTLVPFDCAGQPFVVQDVSAVLNEGSFNNGTATLTPILPAAGIEYNNLAYRSTDGLLYAVELQGTGYGNGIVQIIRIDANGTIENLGLPPGLPTGLQTRFDAGCISADGNTMYISFGARSNDPNATLGYHLNLYKIDLGSWAGPPDPLPAVTIVPITGDNAWVNDWACGPGGLLYGGDQWGTGAGTPSQLSVLDPDTGVRTDYAIPGMPDTGAFGAAWYDNLRGTIFLYRNTGVIYEIDVSDLAGAGPSILQSWTAPASTRNDGTFCATALSIGVKKYVSSVSDTGPWIDANAAPGPFVQTGSDVWFLLEVTNTGNVDLYNISLTDTDFDVSGCVIVDPLTPGASDICIIGPFAAIEGQHTDTVSAVGEDIGGNPTDPATDPANYFGSAPSLTLEKLVSVDGGITYHEADAITGPTATLGGDVFFRFVVTNTGNVDLYNIGLTDTNYDVSGCGNVGPLAPGAFYTCDIGPFTAIADQQTNTADANGEDINGIPAPEATDPANYFGCDCSIDLEKSVSVDGGVTYDTADAAPGPTATVGSDLYFKFEVTNTSNINLYNVVVTDPDFPTLSCGNAGPVVPGASFSCVFGPLTAVAGQQTNTATVVSTKDEGGTISGPEATDPANYFGGVLSIAVEKTVSVDGGSTYHDADTTPGPTATVGNNVYFSFLVTNTGDVTLTNITLTDSDFDLSGCGPIPELGPDEFFTCDIGPFTAVAGQHTNTTAANGEDVFGNPAPEATDPANYFGAQLSIDLEKSVSLNGVDFVDADAAPGLQIPAGGSVWFRFVVTNTSNVNLYNIAVNDPDFTSPICTVAGPVSPGANEICTIGPFIAAVGQQTNTATATGEDIFGNPAPEANDPANYLGAEPIIALEKFVSVDGGVIYHEADMDPGPTAIEGNDVYFRFLVTNTGNVDLYNISLGDTDFDVTGCSNSGPLAPGAFYTCTIGPFPATAGQHYDLAVAEGVDAFGNPAPGVRDPAHYYAELPGTPAIGLEKSVSVDGGVTFLDADEITGPEVPVGSDIYFKFVVENTGDVDLYNITLNDPDYDTSGCTIPALLAAATSFTCVIGPLTAVAGQQTNTAAANGEDMLGNPATEATDPANYYGAVPAIMVEKFISVVSGMGPWDTADTAPGQQVMAGTDIWFLFVITNTGNVALTNIALNDSDFDVSGCGAIPDLAPGETFECVIGPLNAGGVAHYDLATVTGDYDGQTVQDDDPVYYAGDFWAFTPGFWKNNIADKGKRTHDAWIYTNYTTHMHLGDVFDAACMSLYSPKRGKHAKTYDRFTLLEALSFMGGEDVAGGMGNLLRAAVAALLNASFHEVMGNDIGAGGVYPYTVDEVIALVNAALCSNSRETMLSLYTLLDDINNGIHYIDWNWVPGEPIP